MDIDPAARVGYHAGMSRGRLSWCTVLVLGLAGACNSVPEGTGAAPPRPPVQAPSSTAASPTSAATPATPTATRFEAPSLTHPAPKRLVAFGDVHGDLDATRRALRLAGAIDAADRWIGGSLFVVQTGDQLDRGDDDRAILDLFDRLREEAKSKGGTFLALNGNHELMNAQLDFRYVTAGAHSAFSGITVPPHPAITALPEPQRGRAAAFLPGGPYAKRLAERPVIAIVGDSVFVHGGVLMKHLTYGLEKLDSETRAWLRGERPEPPRAVTGSDGVVWLRDYSAQTGDRECAELTRVLDALGAKRMVMGHTPQKPNISEACGGRAVRIDTGMSRHYGGKVQVFEIQGDKTRVLAE